MITENHNGRICFKLTIEYTDYGDSSPFEKYIVYGESFDEVFDHGVEAMNDIQDRDQYVIDFRIQDDSK